MRRHPTPSHLVGSYELELRIRHPDRAVLERVKDLPLLLRVELPAALECPVLADRGPASVGGGTQMPAGFLRKDARRALYVRRPDKAAPSWVDPGDVMVGSINLYAGLLGGSRAQNDPEAPHRTQSACRSFFPKHLCL